MTTKRRNLERLIVHLVFLGVGAGLLLFPRLPTDYAAYIFVVAYNLFAPAYFLARGDREFVTLWGFLLPLSVFQIAPDWFLCEVLQTLEFPVRAATERVPVPAYMGGMWTYPLAVSTLVGLTATREWGPRAGTAVSLTAGAVVFGLGEVALTRVPVWQPVGVSTLYGWAWYLIVPEMLLAAATFWTFLRTRRESLQVRLAGAFAVMVSYVGAAWLSYVVVETMLVG